MRISWKSNSLEPAANTMTGVKILEKYSEAEAKKE